MSKYGLGDLHQALRTYLQSGLDAGQVLDAGNVPAPYLTAARTWVPGIWTGCYVQITDGAGIGQFMEIFDNNNDSIFLVDPWTTMPDTTSVFKIMLPPPGMGTAMPVEVTNTSLTVDDVADILLGLEALSHTVQSAREAVLLSGSRLNQPNELGIADGDISQLFVNDIGSLYVSDQGPAPLHFDEAYATQQASTTIWTPAAGRRIYITDIMISTEDMGEVTLEDEGNPIRSYFLAAGGGAVEGLQTHKPLAAADNRLQISTSGAMNIFVSIGGYER